MKPLGDFIYRYQSIFDRRNRRAGEAGKDRDADLFQVAREQGQVFGWQVLGRVERGGKFSSHSAVPSLRDECLGCLALV
jgi:hypothetical protein